MEFIKPGKPKPKAAVDKAVKVKQIKAGAYDDSVLPTRIEVEQQGTIATTVPSSVWRCKPFKWDPQAFALESDDLVQKIIEPSVQDKSLARFIKNPSLSMIYGVSGNPDDLKAKLFAAYLMDVHCKRYRADSNPWWVNLTGGFENPWINGDRSRPTMIVLTNLTPQSTNLKLEKARDIIESFPDVPRIVVVAGQDPMSFLSTRLHVPINGLAYMCEAVVRRKVEMI